MDDKQVLMQSLQKSLKGTQKPSSPVADQAAFSMTLDGQTYTDMSQAYEALTAAMEAQQGNGEAKEMEGME